jgi:hypothetical protein
MLRMLRRRGCPTEMILPSPAPEPAPEPEYLTTEAGDRLVTEAGDPLTTEG